MDPAHAAYAIKSLLKSKAIVPMHYGTFPLLKGTPKELKDALGDFRVKLTVMKPGIKQQFYGLSHPTGNRSPGLDK
jgi:L-ascorbate metabolism protein UlaG (beta-lactamase superfamily)